MIRDLFHDYAAWLRIDLCYQGFADELAALPGLYAPLTGMPAFSDRRKRFSGLRCGAPVWRHSLRDEAAVCAATIPRTRSRPHAGRASGFRSPQHRLRHYEAGYIAPHAWRDSALRVVGFCAALGILRNTIAGDGVYGVAVVTTTPLTFTEPPTVGAARFSRERFAEPVGGDRIPASGDFCTYADPL
jgi:hypothetical protein